VAILAAADARAQGFDAERFTPAAGAMGWTVAESPVVPFHLGLGLGLFVHGSDDALVVRDQGNGDILSRPLDTAVSADVLASLGLFDVAELALHLPVRLVYDGDPYDTGGGTTVAAGAGVGDLRIVPKVRIGSAGSLSSHVVFGLAVPISVPTGDDNELRGAGGVVLDPKLLILGRFGPVGLLGNVGYRWRSQHPANLAWGDEITFDVGAAVAVTSWLEPFVELNGAKEVATDVDGGSTELPLEALLGLALRPSPDWTISAGVGIGVSDGLGSPDLRGFLGIRWAPSSPTGDGFGDRDQDGVADRDDDCPDDVEDADGFADEDGCPEPDNDRDGVADEDDECPDQPEETGGDGDGCPDRTYVKIEEGKIYIFGKVQFRSGSTELSPKSEPLLDQVAVALQAQPDVKVRVEGHTDDTGPPATNQELSEKRAEAVREALVKRGVSGDRLQAHGYGETQPRAPNRTAAGRAKNRRVEFVIIE